MASELQVHIQRRKKVNPSLFEQAQLTKFGCHRGRQRIGVKDGRVGRVGEVIINLTVSRKN